MLLAQSPAADILLGQGGDKLGTSQRSHSVMETIALGGTGCQAGKGAGRCMSQ